MKNSNERRFSIVFAFIVFLAPVASLAGGKRCLSSNALIEFRCGRAINGLDVVVITGRRGNAMCNVALAVANATLGMGNGAVIVKGNKWICADAQPKGWPVPYRQCINWNAPSEIVRIYS
ncbi:hypothetical protein [Burkholderia sp. TSV86]|uniref:hypothetical protein n=1 Tax=Burkholderia sp. TSV86 TaxID=1385594 RepID=UPI0012E398FE|nr:hypothetical protein [Burkholderia sp. TSV86]